MSLNLKINYQIFLYFFFVSSFCSLLFLPIANAQNLIFKNESLEKKILITNDLTQTKIFEHELLLKTKDFSINQSKLITKHIESEKTKFLSFFTKEIDPYSKNETDYSKCLIKSSSHRIYFYSGPNNALFQCFANQLKNKSIKYWLACSDKVIEVTILNVKNENWEITCDNKN